MKKKCVFLLCAFLKIFFTCYRPPYPKGQMSFRHHLASVVRRRTVVLKHFAFKSSPLKLHGQLEPNFARMILICSTKIAHFILIRKKLPSQAFM